MCKGPVNNDTTIPLGISSITKLNSVKSCVLIRAQNLITWAKLDTHQWSVCVLHGVCNIVFLISRFYAKSNDSTLDFWTYEGCIIILL